MSGSKISGSFTGDGSGLTSLPSQTANDFTTVLKDKLEALLLTSAAAITGSSTALSSSIASDVATNTTKLTAIQLSNTQGCMDRVIIIIKGLSAPAISGSTTALSSSIASDIATNITAITLNTAKNTNVVGDLGVTTSETTVIVTTTNGDNATIPVSNGTVGGVMSKVLFDKLDGIEASATIDQTDAEIRTAVEAATDSNVFTDADHTKLNALLLTTAAAITGSSTSLSSSIASDIATNTTKLTADTTNVTNAGAVMDSEVTALTLIKGLTATAISGSVIGQLPTVGDGGLTTNDFTDEDHSKLDAIESNATADQTNAEIRNCGRSSI